MDIGGIWMHPKQSILSRVSDLVTASKDRINFVQSFRFYPNVNISLKGFWSNKLEVKTDHLPQIVAKVFILKGEHQLILLSSLLNTFVIFFSKNVVLRQMQVIIHYRSKWFKSHNLIIQSYIYFFLTHSLRRCPGPPDSYAHAPSVSGQSLYSSMLTFV